MSRLIAITTLLAACASDYELSGDNNSSQGDDDRPGDDDTPDTTPFDPSDTASVTGRICNTAGNSYVVNADASISYDTDGDGAEDGLATDLTDAEGWFTLTDVPLGSHTILIEKGSFTATIDIVLDTPNEELQLANEECLDPGSVEIAVISGDYDHVESLLSGLGLEFTIYRGTSGQTEYMSLLQDPDLMAEYDIIFFNCGMDTTWSRNASYDTVAANIKDYVQAGGSIYTSDWAYNIFEAAFPGAADFYGEDSVVGSAYWGADGYLTANVLDPTFQSLLGSNTAQLNYDLASWAVVETASSNTEVLLSGNAPLYLWGSVNNSPLAIRFSSGSGVALYTSFHNEQQATVDMEAILEEIILSL
ncbi:MAG: hypothetical protein ACI8RZ_004010 [Myxococcota bacterium]|jgi:hypothetical protein